MSKEAVLKEEAKQKPREPGSARRKSAERFALFPLCSIINRPTLTTYSGRNILTSMEPHFDLRTIMHKDRERRLSLGLTDERIRAYTDALWAGKSREEAFASATLGLELDEADRVYVADCLENIPGREEV